VRYKTAVAFRTALEQRLNASAAGLNELLLRQRKLVTFERFVARIQSGRDDRWLLKGGFALQLRLGDRARTTRDVDVSANLGAFNPAELTPERIGEVLAEAAAVDLGDFFVYQVGTSRELALKAGPVRAYRYPVNGLLGGRTFESFHVDAGVGDPVVASPVDLPPTGLLDFAELPPVTFRAVSPQQHFAEKVHAMTLPREGSENSRTHDLADLMLLLDLELPSQGDVRSAIERIFDTRTTHPIPATLPDPPDSWRDEYAALARDLALAQHTLDDAMQRIRDYWKELKWPST